MFGKSQLKHLSLYDNELQGDAALGDIKELFIVLRNLEFINLDGNLFYKIDMMALKSHVSKKINQEFDRNGKISIKC